MIHKKIERLIPYVNENLITFPLLEEGNYTPFVNFWQIVDKKNNRTRFVKLIINHFKNSGYGITYAPNERYSNIVEFYIYPVYKVLKNGSYKYIKKDWSIEEMIELAIEITRKPNGKITN